MAPTALVLVSHSRALAQGCAEVAAQMAPDVLIVPAGGSADGGIGTSYDLVEQGVQRALEQGAGAVVLLSDLGSATMTAESVLQMLAQDRVLLADAPFVEGAVAAAVAAQAGSEGIQVRDAAQRAIEVFRAGTSSTDPSSTDPSSTDPVSAGPEAGGEVVRRTVELRNRHGLHARPAATLARRVAEFDAQVLVNGVDATSVLALMGLGLARGAQIEVAATGSQAVQVLETICADVEAGFGEE